MRKERALHTHHRWVSAILVLIAVSALTACDNDLIVSSTVTGIDLSPGSVLGVTVVANLRTEAADCQKATILYDGEELDGARTACIEGPAGCTHLQIDAIAPASPGPHTIAIEVLRQKRTLVEYQIDGEVLVQRGGIPPVEVLLLEPRNRQLEVNDRVTYEILIPE